ncbi:hypothetical protein EG68_00922 [Paragonimus skrjabini miyazakii]|uniref:Uncharacterized protein n=1 Tax=Paragonimus skrjabini miyazakii TaxID=59628 RepID=A0A8S9ZC03_9TREM|nr:hypothetical protein EG68_00922 [Paragonimus skrjabini miyazakii]
MDNSLHYSYTQTNVNNLYSSDALSILQRLPPIHKLRRSIRQFHIRSSPLTHKGALEKRWTKEWDEQFKKMDYLSKPSLHSDRVHGNSDKPSTIRRDTLVLGKLHMLDTKEPTCIKSLPDVARKLSFLLNSIDNHVSKSHGISSSIWKSADVTNLALSSQSSSSSSLNQTEILNNTEVQDMEVTLSELRSPRTCLQELNREVTFDNKPSAVQSAEGQDNLDKNYTDIIDLLERTNRGTFHHHSEASSSTNCLPALVNQTIQAKIQPHNLTHANVSNTAVLRDRVKQNEENVDAEPIKPSSIPQRLNQVAGFAAARDRRQSLFALQQLKLATQRKTESEWETNMSKANASRKLRVIVLAFQFTDLLIQGVFKHRGLSNNLQDSRERAYRRYLGDSPSITCPLLQATLRSFVLYGQPNRNSQEQTTILSNPTFISPQLPFYLASLRIGGKPGVTSKTVDQKDITKSANRSIMKVPITTRPIHVLESDIKGNQQIPMKKLLISDQVQNCDPVLRLTRVKIELKKMIKMITENLLGDYDFQTIQQLRLMTMLSNLVRDRCRDWLRINHACDECFCRQDSEELLSQIYLERTQDTACYSIIVHTHIVEKRDQVVMIASQCLHETDEDSTIRHVQENKHLVVVVVVYLIRKYVYFRNDAKRYLNNPTMNTLYKHWLDDRVCWVDRDLSGED